MQQAIASKIMSRITDANLHCAAVQYTFVFEIGPLGPLSVPYLGATTAPHAVVE